METTQIDMLNYESEKQAGEMLNQETIDQNFQAKRIQRVPNIKDIKVKDQEMSPLKKSIYKHKFQLKTNQYKLKKQIETLKNVILQKDCQINILEEKVVELKRKEKNLISIFQDYEQLVIKLKNKQEEVENYQQREQKQQQQLYEQQKIALEALDQLAMLQNYFYKENHSYQLKLESSYKQKLEETSQKHREVVKSYQKENEKLRMQLQEQENQINQQNDKLHNLYQYSYGDQSTKQLKAQEIQKEKMKLDKSKATKHMEAIGQLGQSKGVFNGSTWKNEDEELKSLINEKIKLLANNARLMKD